MKLHTSLFSVGSVKGVGFEPEYISLPKRNLTLPTRVSNPTSDYMQPKLLLAGIEPTDPSPHRWVSNPEPLRSTCEKFHFYSELSADCM